MNIKIIENADKEVNIAVVYSEKILLRDENSALDFMMTVRHETDCFNIILNKEAVTEDFFNLSTRIAGNVLQKFVNYGFKIALVGNFSDYKSKSRSFRDFVYESNKGRNVFFFSTEKEAAEKLYAVTGIENE